MKYLDIKTSDINNECWKPIPETNNLLYISTFGRVYSKHTNRFRKPYKDGKGYLMVDYRNTQNKRLCKKVHRLVAELFLYKRSHNLIVNHIDGDKTNNHISNLEWVTHKENTQHMLRHGLKTSFPNNLPHKEQPVLCVELDKVFKSMREASKSVGVPQSNISKVCRGQRKSAGGYTWKYIEGEKY